MPSVYPITVNSEGYEFSSGGVSFRRRYVVQNVNDIHEVTTLLNGTDLPMRGEQLSDYTADVLRCDTISIQPADDQNDTMADGIGSKTYYVECNWTTPSGTLIMSPEPPEEQRVSWDIGTISMHTETDVQGGREIGARYYLTEVTGTWYPNPDEPDPDAEIGSDVLVPAITVQVEMPLGTYPAISTYVALTGTTNQNDLTIGGITIPAEHALYLGASVETSNMGNARVIHNLTVGRINNLPATLPKIQDWNEDDWTDDFLPLRYGYFVRYKKNEADQNRPIQAHDLRVYRAYANGNHGLLGIV